MNPRPPPCEGDALPAEPLPHNGAMYTAKQTEASSIISVFALVSHERGKEGFFLSFMVQIKLSHVILARYKK